MLKRIPKSDISIRPFKVYKEWNESTSNASTLEALSTFYSNLHGDSVTASIDDGYLSGDINDKVSTYGQLRAQFYNGNDDNIFIRSGHKRNEYEKRLFLNERYLNNYAKIISIPQIAIGDGIRKLSVRIVDETDICTDDGFGNLKSNNDGIVVSLIDNQTNEFYFRDLLENPYTASTIEPANLFIDLEAGTIKFQYESGSAGIQTWGANPIIELYRYDGNNGLLVVNDLPFLPEEAQGIRVGNVFYNQGLIVFTLDADIRTRLADGWSLDYKSTETIYENEFLLIVEPDEFNISQNPSAVVEVGRVTEYITGSDNRIYKTTTNAGVKYIRKISTLENGNVLDYSYTSQYNNSISGGFEDYEYKTSLDSTGSYLAPFITTIGLYDDNCDLVAVAKIPQPIKSDPELPINFIIRFDT